MSMVKVVAGYVLFFTVLVFIAFSHPKAHGQMLTPACAPLADIVNSETIKQGQDNGAEYVLLEGDDAKHVSDRIQEINDDPALQVDRLDLLFFPSGFANMVSSYSGCIQSLDHVKLDKEHLEQYRTEGKL